MFQKLIFALRRSDAPGGSLHTVADMMQQGVMIGRTTRAIDCRNNVLLFAPALVATKDDIDLAVAALDLALGRLACV
jgi:4-aminobutyrate aminotransferase-like enzyme